MGVPAGLTETLQAAGIRALELLAIRQTLISAVPPCPAVSLACPPANVSCPPQVCPAYVCPPPACPAPLVNLSCPLAGLPPPPEGLDVPSALWGGLAGLWAGLGLSGAAWRRGRTPGVEAAGVGDRAREQLQLLRRKHGEMPRAGAAAAPAAAGTVWLETEDHRGLRRGVSLPDPLPDESATHGDMALVPHAGGFVAARQVPVAEVDAFVVDDLRALPVRFNQERVRRRPFSEAVDIQVGDEPEGGVMLSGPRACAWVLRSWRDAGLTPITHHANWLRSGHIPDGDRSVHEHEVLTRVLDSSVTVDQLNAPALQSAELICRRIQLIEDAHASAADDYMGWAATHRQGAAVAPDQQQHVATAMRDRAAILKEGPQGEGGGGGKTDAGGSEWRRLTTPSATDNRPLQAVLSLQRVTCGALPAWGQRQIVSRPATAAIRREVRLAPKSDSHFSRRGAAKELLASSLSYAVGEAPSPVARCARSRVGAPEVGAAMPPVESVLDEIGESYVLDYEQTMMKTPDEWPRALDSEPPVTPYMDEVLKRDPAAYKTFIGDLVRANMLGFTRRPKDLVTPFFVARKGGARRLVWGARVPNRRFRDPPPLATGTSAAHGRLQLPDDRGEAGGCSTELFCAQADVRNYFYALGLREELGLFFSLPPRANAHVCRSASGLGAPRALADRGPVPPLDGGAPCLLPYCDNISAIGTGPDRRNTTMHLICDARGKHGAEIHEVVEASDVPASMRLEQRPRVTGREVERYVGHLIDHFMLKRELLSILRSLCDFVRDCYHVLDRLRPSAAREVEQRRRLLPLMSANLRLQWSPAVFAYDACQTGVAACQTSISSGLVRRIGPVSERWRYRMPSAILARRSALGVGAAEVDEASEGPRDVFADVEAAKAPRLTNEDHVEDPWELNPHFTEVPREALQGPEWKQAVSARVHVKGAIAIVERPAASPRIVQKGFLQGRPFVGATKEERVAHRPPASRPFAMARGGERSFLEWNAVTPETQAYYKEALDDFQVFVDLHAPPLRAAAQVDLALTSYADYAWNTGLERAVVLKTYVACISGWRRPGPGQTRPPTPRQTVALVALAMATQLAAPRAALIVATMFWAYLGPSEAVGPREQDLFFLGGSSKDCGFNLRPSAGGECGKTTLSDESLPLDSPEAPRPGPLLVRARSGDPRAPLFGLTAAKLGLLWRQALALAGMPTKCVPCQLRHGGPSHDRLMRRRSAAEIKARGRRASDYTTKRYEARAMVQQELVPLPDDARRRAEAAPRRLRAELERQSMPPAGLRRAGATLTAQEPIFFM
ncbi:unnamed protein product, partial [Prorocentrum cordatum]